jgi:hypothetical protein
MSRATSAASTVNKADLHGGASHKRAMAPATGLPINIAIPARLILPTVATARLLVEDAGRKDELSSDCWALDHVAALIADGAWHEVIDAGNDSYKKKQL